MTLRSALLFALLLVAAPAPAQTPLEIDLQAPGTPVSPTLHGLMTEEINYSYDGGLYAELIRNRAFLDDTQNQPVHWTTIEQRGAGGRNQDRRHPPPHRQTPQQPGSKRQTGHGRCAVPRR